MPYISVWVDDERCDGSCGASKQADELQSRIDEATSLLVDGHTEEALQALTDDRSTAHKSPKEIAREYLQWKEGRLPGFIAPATAATQSPKGET